MKHKGYKNKNVIALQLALKFVEEHKELFEKWLKEKYEKGMV